MRMPPPWEPIDQSSFSARWPMSAEKCELIDGVIIWYGDFEEVDRDVAERAFPGRVVVLIDGGLEGSAQATPLIRRGARVSHDGPLPVATVRTTSPTE